MDSTVGLGLSHLTTDALIAAQELLAPHAHLRLKHIRAQHTHIAVLPFYEVLGGVSGELCRDPR